MSHYDVAVFTTDKDQSIDTLLAPYDENTTVEPYVQHTKAELIRKTREFVQALFDTEYKKWKRYPKLFELKRFGYPAYICSLKLSPTFMKMSDDELYQERVRGMEHRLNENGDLLTTYNPDSKWDWYRVGGGWNKTLIRKGTGERCNTAFVRDIDFEAMKREAVARLQPHEKAIVGSYTKDPSLRERFPTEEEYLTYTALYGTFAVVTPDGKWHAPGTMGWWGISSASSEDERDWYLGYYERFIKPALEKNWYLTIVDCHI
jgi:hypothetical protein